MIRASALLLSLAAGAVVFAQELDRGYLTWSQKQAQSVGMGMRVPGRVGGALDVRLLRTERSFNYKLLATWITPDVVRATARLRQLTMSLGEPATVAAVQRAVAVKETTFLVEIDPREGSGVIPLDWVALLVPKATGTSSPSAVPARMRPDLREDPLFAGVARRDYDYDRFWVSFPLNVDGHASIPASATSLDLVVRIYEKEGRVSWPITAGMAQWLSEVAGR